MQTMFPVGHILNFRGGEVRENIADRTALELAGAFRPSGIFMSTALLGMLILISTALIFYFLLIKKDVFNRALLIMSYVCCWVSAICAVSRSCVFYIVGITAYVVFFSNNPKIRSLFLKYSIIMLILGSMTYFTPLGQKAIDNMLNRFDNASISNVGTKRTTVYGTIYDIWNRNVVYTVDALVDPHTLDGASVPFFGYGQGMSTQVGGKLLRSKLAEKNSGFALAEWDGLRVMCESGMILGWIVIYIRMAYTFRYLFQLMRYKRKGYYLPILLFPVFFFSFNLGFTWGNVTNANFAFLMAGLFMATLRFEKILAMQSRIK